MSEPVWLGCDPVPNVVKSGGGTSMWPFLFCFSPETENQDNFFDDFTKFFDVYPREKFFDGATFFCKFSWHRCDSIDPKMVEIGTVLAIFRALKFRECCPAFPPVSFSEEDAK